MTLAIASISGSLDLRSARIACPGKRALVLDRAEIGGSDGRNIVVTGGVRMHNTRVGPSMTLPARHWIIPPGRRWMRAA